MLNLTGIRKVELDINRRLLKTTSSLKLQKRVMGSTTPQDLLTIETGWNYTENDDAALDYDVVLEITERSELTALVMADANTVTFNSRLFSRGSYDAPDEQPRVWLVYCREFRENRP